MGTLAEYGHSASGAVVNVTIKNGTNQFHGAVWEFFRNDAMDAHGWTPTLGGIKPEVRFNQYGANIGGPLVKDKTFFFVNYEGDREHNGGVFQATVPTLALAQGNFANPPAGLGATLKVQPVDPYERHAFPERQHSHEPVESRGGANPYLCPVSGAERLASGNNTRRIHQHRS